MVQRSPSRRLALALLAAPALLLARRPTLAGWLPLGSPGSFPGQERNPVGFAAAPGFTGLTPHANTGFVDNTTYSFLDIDALTDGTTITGNNITFIGCRFQSNQLQNNNVAVSGTNITFSYCSITPRVALNPTPFPNATAWPSNGVGLGIYPNSPNASDYCIPGNNGYEYGILITGTGAGPITIDHCDLWGAANAVVFRENRENSLAIRETEAGNSESDPNNWVCNRSLSHSAMLMSSRSEGRSPASRRLLAARPRARWDLCSSAELGRESLSQTHSLQPTPERRALRGLGTTGTIHTRAADCI
jgi:hypothetical protein